jgi:formylglycine-generating enzyme required for sulfatase activity
VTTTPPTTPPPEPGDRAPIGPPPGIDRDARIQAVLDELRRERAAGRRVYDSDVIARYPELLPELADALSMFYRIQTSIRQVAAAAGSDAGEPTSPDAPPLPRIAGYRMQRPLQRGGQAAVFLATQKSTHRNVAIKVLDGGAFVTQRKYARFEREVKALAALDHPGIVRIVDRGRTADGSYFMAMDYVDGEDLDAHLDRRRAEGWDARSVAGLFAHVAAALGDAHRLDIVHRDVKPSNVRVDLRGQPRVLDFGLARLTATADDDERPVTQTDGVVGSLPWASPEQVTGDAAKICPASDVYSLGVALYRALTGRSPYDLSGTLREQMRNICEVIPPSPAKVAAEAGDAAPFGPIDPVLDRIILRCLEKDPARRYHNGTALSAELEAYLAGWLRPSLIRRVPWRRLAAAACVLAAVAAIGAEARVVLHNRSAADSARFRAVELPTFTNSIGTQLSLIPLRPFHAGSPLTEEGRDQNEQFHSVTLTRPYYLARTEVTRAEYRRVMGALPKWLAAREDDDRLPVEYVSRDDAEEFCRRLGRAEGRHYRLPTEAEWENACRAGTDTPYSGTGRVDDMAWYYRNSSGTCRPVATRHANHWGLYDTQGNVAEWCADRYLDRLGYHAVTDPFAPPVDDDDGVVRGGSMYDYPTRCRAAARTPLPPDQETAGIGFRIAMDPPPAPATRPAR